MISLQAAGCLDQATKRIFLSSSSKPFRSPSARFFSTTSILASKDRKPPSLKKQLDRTQRPFGFALPTYDKAFKDLLHDAEVRNSLFQGFVDGTIQSSEILGLSNRTLKDQDQVRMDSLGAFLNRYKPLMDDYLANQPVSKSKKSPVLNSNTLLHDLATKYYNPLCALFPIAEKESYMDFVCRLEDGSSVLVEMQVRTEPYWNSRALAYAARIYSSQLVRGESWEGLKKVYAINILGGYEPSKGNDVRHSWKNHSGSDDDGTPSVIKRYQLVNLHNPADKIPDLEIIQIFPQLFMGDSTKLKGLGLGDDQVSLASEWLELFKEAQFKNKSYVDQVKNHGVKRAYSILEKKELADNYQDWRKTYGPVYADNIVQEAAAAKKEGRAEGRAEVLLMAVRALKELKTMTDSEIATKLGLTEAELSSIDLS